MKELTLFVVVGLELVFAFAFAFESSRFGFRFGFWFEILILIDKIEVLLETSPSNDLYFILILDLVLVGEFRAGNARSFWDIGINE